NERLGRNSLSAALIDLAVRGYLKITETKKKKIIGSTDEYQLELLKDIDELPDSERQLLKGLFDKGKAGETVSLADKANKLSGTYEALSRSVPKGLAKRRYFAVDPNKA